MTTPRGLGVRVGLELLELGDDEDRLEQVVEALPASWPRRRRTRSRRPSPTGWRPRCVISVRTRVGVGALLVDLVDRDDDRHLGRLRVVDRLVGLRLDAVVGGDDDHGDVGHLGAAGAHGGERLVARRVEEGDRLAVVVHLVGADVLGDAAGLAGDDVGLADRVEQRGLAVVDVAHDRDDRRALDEVVRRRPRRRARGPRRRSAWTISTSLPNSSARTRIASSESVCVSVAISPMPMSFLMTSGTGTPRYSATSLTVEPELTLTRSVELCAVVSSGCSDLVAVAAAAATAAAALRRAAGAAAGRRDRRAAARGLRVDDDAALAAGAGAAGRAAGPRLVALGALGRLGDGDDLRAGAGRGRLDGRDDLRAGAGRGLRALGALAGRRRRRLGRGGAAAASGGGRRGLGGARRGGRGRGGLRRAGRRRRARRPPGAGGCGAAGAGAAPRLRARRLRRRRRLGGTIGRGAARPATRGSVGRLAAGRTGTRGRGAGGAPGPVSRWRGRGGAGASGSKTRRAGAARRGVGLEDAACGRCRRRGAARRRGARRGGGHGLGGAARPRASPSAAPAMARSGVVLLDGGGGGLHLQAGGLQGLEQLLAGEVLLLGDLVYALLGH